MKYQLPIAALLLAAALTLPACDFRAAPAPEAGARPAQTGESPWKEIRPGLRYAQIHFRVGASEEYKDSIVALVDPKKYSFGVVQNSDKKTAKTIREIHGETGSLLTFNGGFFTEEFKPTGLLISEGEKLRNASGADLLDGILALTDEGDAKLFSNKSSLDEKRYTFAIQNGPVLIDSKGRVRISKDTGKTASRTAIGLDGEGNVALIILKQSLLNADNRVTLFEFARLLKESPEFAKLDLRSVLNLDGGPSTGMMVGDRYFPEMEKVQNVVIVKERSA